MCCPKWRWSRRRPAALSQCISSNVHRRFKRLLFGGCTSGSVRGFGCESRAVRWVAVRSRKTVWTYGMCRSEWWVWLETYHGALVIYLRSLDWYRWITAMLFCKMTQKIHYLQNVFIFKVRNLKQVIDGFSTWTFLPSTTLP